MTAIIETRKDPAKAAKAKELVLPAWRTRVSKTERPPTPSVPFPDEDELAFEQAIKFMQRIIRGRAVQMEMFRGKEKRIELIRELRAADEAAAGSVDDPGAAEREAALAKEVRKQADKAAVAEAAVETVAGEMASAMLDYLSKELVRREEMDRLNDLAKYADNERRTREAEEAGRRQAEEKLRARNDEVYKQVVAANLAAARTFVDEIVEGAVEEAAADQAVRALRQSETLAADLARAATCSPREEATARVAFVKELVASFLTPAVEQMQVREEDREDEKHLADAAQKSVVEAMAEVTRNPL
mmetsp:Transcript_27481/g.84824  ORF Transcript_27481/g.84824 Transcript_27481/m.84824 type:complete len:302 (-) Transcript_27481:76-981(-)